MKMVTEVREITRDGRTHQVPMQVPAPPPAPKDWDRVAIGGAVGLVLTLTIVAVAWSTVSIGSLLSGVGKELTPTALAAAALFDLAWIINLLLEWLSRYDSEKRRFPKVVGWLLLAVTMGAIAWHGALLDSWELAVVGAAVSLVAKILWMGIMAHIQRDLSPDDEAWVRAELSSASRTLAMTRVQRQVARTRGVAAAERLAIESTYGPTYDVQHDVQHDVQPVRQRTEDTLELAVQALLEDANGVDGEAVDAAIEDARTDGWTLREVYETASGRRRTPDHIRPDVSGHPQEDVSTQVSKRGAVPTPPETSTVSIRSAVHRVVSLGVDDVRAVAHQIASVVGRSADDPKFQATVARYIREATTERQEAPAQTGTGQYL